MEQIHFERLQADVQAWGEIQRDTLHAFPSPAEEQRYQQTMDAVLKEIVNQVTVRLNQEQEAAVFLEKVKGPALSDILGRLLAHWKEIQNVKGYIAVSLGNI